MKLTDHKTESVYRRYAIVAKADLTEGVAKLARLDELLKVKSEASALRRMSVRAHQAGRVAQMPYIPSLHVNNARKGFFEQPQLDAVLAHLAEDLRPPILFAALTGWRKSEVLGLTWDLVNFVHGEVRLEVGTTKNDEGRVFPFSALPALADLIYQQRERTDKLEKELKISIRPVFHRRGKVIMDMYKRWR